MSTRRGTPAWDISAATRGACRLRREQQRQPRRLGRRRDRGQLPRVLEVGTQVFGRLVDPEQGRIGHRAGPEPVPVLRLGPRQQRVVDGGRTPQQVVSQPQVVAARDAHPGRRGAAAPTSRCRPRPSVSRRTPALRRTPQGRPSPARATRPRRPRGRAPPAGGRARPGSWAHGVSA
ncbi:hypothetical protein [Nocardioides sp. B-3]|uniref:hypothetical protein n=1 Tax=Nocardioides sp. B-3 TaxID=2895565 RepID=UPI002153959D|nr:hypothetical protein [Nocardioides sp. B-3]UUZ60365.1 hypothetical protein LP418_05505 [Nocardioides sp. B-3]